MSDFLETCAFTSFGWFTRKILPTKEATLLEKVLFASGSEIKVFPADKIKDKAVKSYYPIFQHKGSTYWFNTDTDLWYFSDDINPTPSECGNWDKVVERLRFNGASEELIYKLNYFR